MSKISLKNILKKTFKKPTQKNKNINKLPKIKKAKKVIKKKYSQ